MTMFGCVHSWLGNGYSFVWSRGSGIWIFSRNPSTLLATALPCLKLVKLSWGVSFDFVESWCECRYDLLSSLASIIKTWLHLLQHKIFRPLLQIRDFHGRWLSVCVFRARRRCTRLSDMVCIKLALGHSQTFILFLSELSIHVPNFSLKSWILLHELAEVLVQQIQIISSRGHSVVELGTAILTSTVISLLVLLLIEVSWSSWEWVSLLCNSSHVVTSIDRGWQQVGRWHETWHALHLKFRRHANFFDAAYLPNDLVPGLQDCLRVSISSTLASNESLRLLLLEATIIIIRIICLRLKVGTNPTLCCCADHRWHMRGVWLVNSNAALPLVYNVRGFDRPCDDRVSDVVICLHLGGP